MLFTLCGFVLFYSSLLVVDVILMRKYIGMGPVEGPCASPQPSPDPRRRRPSEEERPCPLLIDYEILRLIWWLLLGVLLIGFAIMDGFDLGVATLLPFVARNDAERRMTINTIGPVWDGNQVWLILGGGAIFAAWPAIYATAFSGFYIAMFLVLATLILRPVGFEFRNKIADPRWRAFWDYALFVGGLVPRLVFGVAFGNLLQGVPFQLDGDMRVLYEGSGLFELLNPFGLLCGLVSLAMLVTHGAVYLTLKTEGEVAERARWVASRAPLATIVLFLLAGLYVALGVRGYAITSPVDMNGPSNPLLKTVAPTAGQWLVNYGVYPWMILAPVLAVVGALGAMAFSAQRRAGLAFVASARRHPRRRRDGGREHVPVPDAVQPRPARELHGLGRLVEPTHAVRDADRDADLPADRPHLHQLGVLYDARPGHCGADLRNRAEPLLKGNCDVVLHLDIGRRLRLRRGRHQRAVA